VHAAQRRAPRGSLKGRSKIYILYVYICICTYNKINKNNNNNNNHCGHIAQVQFTYIIEDTPPGAVRLAEVAEGEAEEVVPRRREPLPVVQPAGRRRVGGGDRVTGGRCSGAAAAAV
jgi:hypothetical protein